MTDVDILKCKMIHDMKGTCRNIGNKVSRQLFHIYRVRAAIKENTDFKIQKTGQILNIMTGQTCQSNIYAYPI